MIGAAAAVALAPVAKLLPVPEIAPLLNFAPLPAKFPTWALGFRVQHELLEDIWCDLNSSQVDLPPDVKRAVYADLWSLYEQT